MRFCKYVYATSIHLVNVRDASWPERNLYDVDQSTMDTVEVEIRAGPQTQKSRNNSGSNWVYNKKTREKKFEREKIVRKTLTFDKSAHL